MIRWVYGAEYYLNYVIVSYVDSLAPISPAELETVRGLCD